MAKLILAAALIASTGTSPALSQIPQPDLRCVDVDKAMTQRLRDMLAQDGGQAVGTAPLNTVLARIAAARFDCKHGRIDRGLQTYNQADATLQAMEQSILPRTARSGDAE
jgi:hypothetical protein